MKKFRLLWLPFGALIELVVLMVCWIMAVIEPNTAKKMTDWAMRTPPSIHWYIGE
jgi:hypothetical protein